MRVSDMQQPYKKNTFLLKEFNSYTYMEGYWHFLLTKLFIFNPIKTNIYFS